MTRLSAPLLAAALLAAPAAAQTRQPDPESFFELKVRPVLARRCSRCHGGEKANGGLRVDSRAALLKGGRSGPALVPGDPEKSLLVQAVRHVGTDLRMPPQEKLADAVVADLAAWVKQGAVWPAAKPGGADAFAPQKHWAFRPVKKVEPPPDPSGWARHPIDRFIAAGLRKQGLRPAGAADRRVLLRRLTFDLIGLPPTPQEVEAFLADRSPDALERVVDRLLASPHYGERWGRHWLDVARYADTAGDNADYPIPEARLYRDYVIDSFNADKPYDQFVREQLAGDLLARQGPPEGYAERVVATGFLALARRYATAPYELWHLTLEDAVDTAGQAFLGLTLRCARCHDHKFDPVSQEDYYALYGIFASTRFPYAGSEELQSMNFPRQHFAPLLPPGEAGALLRAHEERLRALQAEIDRTKATVGQVTARRDAAAGDLQAKLNQLRGELRLLRRPGLPPGLAGAYAVSEGTPADAHLHRRGDPDAKGPVVRRGAPKFLTGGKALAIPAGQSGRLQLAEWLTRPDNPLTARVLVNRVWQHHFGRGLVGTPNNFGLRGEPPTHPELLDWLAATFVEKGWSVKALHRLIVLSRTYQQASAQDEAAAAKDPGNRWHWRHDRRRLEAEAIRDALLAVSGTLRRDRPGPHPFPPIGGWRWTQHDPFKEVYPSAHRSVYLMTQRLQRHPFLALFDGPDTNVTTATRARSTVPLQALFLMNSPAVRAEAEAFARRLLAASADARRRVRLAHELAYARPPTEDEVERALRYVGRYRQGLEQVNAPPGRRELEAWLSYARVLLCSNEFIYVD
jgi:cytochrome c553